MALPVMLALSGCGAWQYVKDGTVSATKSLLYTHLTSVKLDLIARKALNSDDKGQPLSVVVRVYQLKDRKAFDAASYDVLLTNDKEVLAADMLSSYQKVLRPGETISLTEPYKEGAKYVAVAAFYHQNGKNDQFKTVISTDALDNDKALAVEFQDYSVSTQLAEKVPMINDQSKTDISTEALDNGKVQMDNKVQMINDKVKTVTNTDALNNGKALADKVPTIRKVFP